MKYLFTIIAIALLFSATSAQDLFKKVKNKQATAKKLSEVSKKINTIESDFLQYKHLDILSSDIESEGHFSFKKTDKLRWEYSKPYFYLIVMNNGTMWIKDSKKTQKYDTKSNKMFKEINDLMIGLLQGNILDSKNFKLNIYENSKYILAELYPQSAEMKEFLSGINIYFDKKDYSVYKVKMNENSGDYTEIIFVNKKNNVSIQNSKFTVK